MKTVTSILFALVLFAGAQSCRPVPAQTVNRSTVDTLKVDTTVHQVKAKTQEVKPSIQCRAITGKGAQCTRRTTDKTGLCWQHNPNHPSNKK